jgi:predicted ferric reductase
MSLARLILIWLAVAVTIAVPIAAAAVSPQLEWRHPVYVAAGFAGIIALGLLLVQPLAIGGFLPGLTAYGRQRLHRWIGGMLVVTVMVHVGGLWITSAPDVIDALLFASPTPFSVWGVVAMWATFATALLAAFQRRMRLRPRTWRICHTILAVVIVIGTIVHAILIEGAMEMISKVALCALVMVATLKVVADFRVWSKRPTSR